MSCMEVGDLPDTSSKVLFTALSEIIDILSFNGDRLAGK